MPLPASCSFALEVAAAASALTCSTRSCITMLIKHQCVLFRRDKNITEKQSCADTAVLYKTAAAPLRHTVAQQTEGYDVRIEWLPSMRRVAGARYVIDVQICPAV